MEVSDQLHAPAALPLVPIGLESGLALRAGAEKRKNLALAGNEPRPSIPYPVAIATGLCRLPHFIIA
jgi:hypothetical protein